MGHLLCGTWAVRVPATAAVLVRDHGPLLLSVVAAVLAACGGWAYARRRVWHRHAARACWLEIVPPVSATPAATVGLWRLLATALPAPGRWSWRPPRIVWEVFADPAGMRCGLWLPPGLNPTAALRLLQRAWPGARADQRPAPTFASGWPVVAVALRPTRPEWLPVVDDPAPDRGRQAEVAPEDDRLRAVYDGLAAAGRTGGGLLQVHVSRAPGHRIAGVRRAATNPDRIRRPATGPARAASILADSLSGLLLGVLNLVTPGRAGRRDPGGRADPYLADLARQARGKLAAAPHLLIAVHAATTGPSVAAAQAAAADITSGYSLLSAHVTRRRLRSARTAATDRWVPPGRMILASVEETAALAGLPTEPSAHGLPSAASRRRPASRDTFTAGPVPHATRRARRPAPAAPPPGDPEPPAVRSAP